MRPQVRYFLVSFVVMILVVVVILVIAMLNGGENGERLTLRDLFDDGIETADEIYDRVFVYEDAYGVPEMRPLVRVDASLTRVHSMNERVGFPNGNVLGVESVCFDDSVGIGYAVGVLTEHVAIFDESGVYAYVDTNFGEGEEEAKSLVCGKGVAYVATSERIAKIDGEKKRILRSSRFSREVDLDSLTYLPDLNLVTVDRRDTDVIDILDGNGLYSRRTISASRSRVFEMEDGRVLVVEIPLDGVFVARSYDASRFREIDALVLNVDAEVFDVAYDSERNSIWMLEKDSVYVVDLDNVEASADRIRVLDEPKKVVYGNDMVVVLSENGFDGKDVDLGGEWFGGYVGGVSVIDAETRILRDHVPVEHQHSDISLDAKHRVAYLSNDDDNSVTKLDLLFLGREKIDVGTSAEHGQLMRDGRIVVANRFGGSSLLHFDPVKRHIGEHLVGGWPVGSAYSEKLDRMFTFNMLSGTIGVHKGTYPALNEVYDLEIPDGKVDAIGDMTHDVTRDVLYPVVPEQHLVLAVDAETGVEVRRIRIDDDWTAREYDQSGPGRLIVGVYEPNATLFVYASEVQRLYVYDGLDEFSLKATVQVEGETGLEDFPYGMYVDQFFGKLYLGSKIYDALTFEEIGGLSRGNVVVGVDADRGYMVTVDLDEWLNRETMYVLDFGGRVLDSLRLASGANVHSRFIFDGERGKVYVLYAVSSEVWEVQIHRPSEGV